jgi:uncharacterized membrane-anchored protein
MPNSLFFVAARRFAAAALAAAFPLIACAQDKPPANDVQAAFHAAQQAMVRGATDVALLDQATLRLPAGFLFIPKEQAARLLGAMGNRPGNDVLGLVLQERDDSHGFIVVRFIKSGYIKDDDAKNWNADQLLSGIKDGTEEDNAERRKRGMREVEVVGWVQAPAYDPATHRLVWSLSSKDKGAPDGAEHGVNYNTYALGREGYFSMNLVTGLNSIEAEKPSAQVLLASLDYKDGKHYGDFNAGTDHIAEYGLAALIGGIAVKKLGLLAVFAAFFVKFAKLILIAGIAVVGVLVKIFRGKRAAATPPTPPAPPQT